MASPSPHPTQRQRFEAWISAPPIEASIYRAPDNPMLHAWPGQYTTYQVQLAWEAWCEAVGCDWRVQ